MFWLILIPIVSGFAAGILDWLPPVLLSTLPDCLHYGVAFLVLAVGIGIGSSRETWKQFAALGKRSLLLPAAVVTGTLTGSLLPPLVTGMGLRESLAVGAGFGWYSLSGVLLTRLHSAELGSVAFLSNVFRELLSILLVPLLARHVGPMTLIAPGGATTMDTTLPLIDRYAEPQAVLMAFLNGLVLSFLVPVLVPLLIGTHR